MSELKENWQQENLEKTKEVLTEHFKRKKEDDMFKEMLSEIMLFSTPTQVHFGTDWDIDDSEFDEFKDDFIWEDLTDFNDKKDKRKRVKMKIRESLLGLFLISIIICGSAIIVFLIQLYIKVIIIWLRGY